MHLSDCFIELFAFVTDFRKRVRVSQPPFEQVKEIVLGLLAQSASLAKNLEISDSEFDDARFAVCAWTDEIMISSGWQHQYLWLKERLQQTLFKTTDAGEEFFERLQRLEPQQREVREIFYLCLALGFTGRFCKADGYYQLQQLKAATLNQLTRESPLPLADERVLFPAAYAAGAARPTPVTERRLSIPAITALIAPLLVFLTLFTIYRLTLGTVAENFLKTVAN